MSRGRALDLEPPVRCEHCRTDIEACDGAHGEWMHSATRREACAAPGFFAAPETPAQIRQAEPIGRPARPFTCTVCHWPFMGWRGQQMCKRCREAQQRRRTAS